MHRRGQRSLNDDPVRRDREAALRERLQDQWAARAGVKPAGGRRAWRRLLGLRDIGDHRHPKVIEHLPGDDHCTLWLRDGKPAVWVSQPYPLGSSTIAQMTYVAEQYGLAFEISTWPAWHNPASVLFVEWTLVVRPVRLPSKADIVGAIGDIRCVAA
jgi:hypothetical protein